MKLYLAGNTPGRWKEELVLLSKKLSQRRLVSFAQLEIQRMDIVVEIWKRIMTGNANKKVELFLDSGAYSALTQGKVIDLDEYIKFIETNHDAIAVYANLDVIGDAEGTWKNQKYMEKRGLHPLPVFHAGEDLEYFYRYLGKYDYICLGGLVGGSNQQLTFWLDSLFEIICDTPDHLPKCKIHGFGLTALDLMLRYPWYSVDSTSWVLTGRHGAVLVPRFRGGKWTYDDNPYKVNVSNQNPTKDAEGKHISTYSIMEKNIIFKYFEEKKYQLGKSEFKNVPETYKLMENERWNDKKANVQDGIREVEIILEPGVSNKYQLRDEMNIMYFLDLESSLPEWPWAFESRTKVERLF